LSDAQALALGHGNGITYNWGPEEEDDGEYAYRSGGTFVHGVVVGAAFQKVESALIAYIIAGVLLGPQGLAIVERSAMMEQLGEMGVILLMFFIGAEIDFHDLANNFRKPLFGALSQLALSFVFIRLAGWYFQWSWPVVVLLTFVISLSSSAIIFQYLVRTGEMNTRLGLLTSGVLIMQDILVVPMLLT